MDPLTERTPRVVSAVKLLRTAERRKVGRFLVEGENSVGEALATHPVHDLFYTADAEQRYSTLIDRAHAVGVRTSLVTDRAVRALSDTVTPPGLVAVCDLLDVPLAEAMGPGTRLLAVPVAVAEPGNAGTVIRVADAVGADAAILAGDSVDPHNGKCVRASAGSLFHLPVVRERDTAAVLDSISAAGIQLLATAADGEVDLDDADELLAAPRRGCSATRPMASMRPPRRERTTGCGSRSTVAPRASTWRRRRRSACIRAPGSRTASEPTAETAKIGSHRI